MMEKTKFEIRCDTFKNHTFDNISEMSEIAMTDMTDSSIIPQFVEEISREVQETQEGVFLKTCFKFDIDPDILINQTREIKRLNRMMEYYIKAADELGYYKELEEQGELQRVRHGKWITQDETYTCFQCSACGSENHSHRWEYCCKCGAKMDGE